MQTNRDDTRSDEAANEAPVESRRAIETLHGGAELDDADLTLPAHDDDMPEAQRPTP